MSDKSTNHQYYQKYLKYKTKYLQLKNEIYQLNETKGGNVAVSAMQKKQSDDRKRAAKKRAEAEAKKKAELEAKRRAEWDALPEAEKQRILKERADAKARADLENKIRVEAEAKRLQDEINRMNKEINELKCGYNTCRKLNKDKNDLNIPADVRSNITKKLKECGCLSLF